MKTVKCTIGQLPGLIARDLARLKRGVSAGMDKTAVEAVPVVRRNVPVAFGELRDSIVGAASSISHPAATMAIAPHAKAVEIGSPPHTPNFEKLLEWVKLRGKQGLRGPAALARAKRLGPTTLYQATRVAKLLRAQVQGRGQGRHSPVDAPEIVARAISRGIEEHGTRPHWYMRSSLPEIAKILNVNVRRGVYGT